MTDLKTLNLAIERAVRDTAGGMCWRPNYEASLNDRIWQEYCREPVVQNLRRYVPEPQDSRILDLGSGMGGLLVRLEQEGLNALGIEFSRRYCEIARLRGQRYTLSTNVVNGCAERLPLRQNSIDVVLAYELIEHVFEPVAMLCELKGILRVEGRVLITVPNRWALYDSHYHFWGLGLLPRRVADRFVSAVGRTKMIDDAGLQRLSDMHYFSWRGFVGLCTRLGFRVHDVREEKLLRRSNELSLSAGVRLMISALKSLKLLKPAYRLYRSTFMPEFHVILRPD